MCRYEVLHDLTIGNPHRSSIMEIKKETACIENIYSFFHQWF